MSGSSEKEKHELPTEYLKPFTAMTRVNSASEDYEISTDKSKLNSTMIHRYLSTEAYWCRGISRELVEKSIAHSLCFGVYLGEEQVGFARVISDFASIAYLGDVFILEAHRGKGLSRKLMERVMEHPELQGMRRWILLTRDAHDLYRKYGWTDIANPVYWMELHNKYVYGQS